MLPRRKFALCLLLFSASAAHSHRVRRSPQSLFRDHVTKETGGKIPESAHLRVELNKIDSAGLGDSHAQRMSDALKNTPLPDKLTPNYGDYEPHQSYAEPAYGYNHHQPGSVADDNDVASFGAGSSFNDQISPFEFPTDFFDAKRIFSDRDRDHDDDDLSHLHQGGRQFGAGNSLSGFNDDFNRGEQKQDFGDQLLSKPHLFTADPYADHAPAHGYNPPPYSPPAKPAPKPVAPYHDPYQPPVHETYSPPAHHDAYAPVHDPYKPHDPYQQPHDPYKPAHDPYKPVHDPYKPVHDPYKPVHDPYKPVHDPYKPAHETNPYLPPHDSYKPAPYKPVGPVLLDKRPHEVHEIKPLSVPVEKAYTSFDCRKAPYPDRHYADPEAGCSIYHFCHANGKQDTFHCPYGTIFNEYLGTCDHDEAVYCTGGKGYKPPVKPAYHHEEPQYHRPEPHYQHHQPGYRSPEPAYHEAPSYGGHYPEERKAAPGYQQPHPPATSNLPYEPKFDFAKTFPGFSSPFRR